MVANLAVALLAASSALAAHPKWDIHATRRAAPKNRATSTASTVLSPAPHWVVYSDSQYSTTEALPQSQELTGYNALIASFWLSSNTTADKLSTFTALSASTREWMINDWHSKDISWMVSAFGDGDAPTTDGRNPVTVADELAAFVKAWGFDGVDIDWEDFAALAEGANAASGKAENWLIDFTKELRAQLPQGEYYITHAPVAPWFTMNTTRYPQGAYRKVHQEVGDLIDWYNVQFYNQGSDYINCPSLLDQSLAHEFPNSSLFEIANPVNANVTLDKLVIGKPTIPGDATNGFLNLTTLGTCVSQAAAKDWSAGVFLWEFHPNASVPGIEVIRGSTFPIPN